jgi:hypothetical protein
MALTMKKSAGFLSKQIAAIPAAFAQFNRHQFCGSVHHRSAELSAIGPKDAKMKRIYWLLP